MTDSTETIDTYFDAWNETDPDTRAGLLEHAWADDCRYVDPLADTSGRAEFDANVAAVQQQFPGHRFARTTAVDAHHDRVRFGWHLVDPTGGIVVEGIDIGQVAPDGRLANVIGFFGPLGEREAR